MQSNSNPLQNVEPGIAVNLILPQSPAQKKMELNGLRSTDSPDKHPIPKKSAGERVRKISVVEPAGIEISKVQSPRNSSISRTPVDEQILTPDEEKQLGLIAQKSEGRKKWLKLKTVQMIDPSTLLGDKDRGLSIREMLVDGLGVWNGTQLRRSLPGAILGVNKKGMSRGNNKWWVTLPSQHKHFNSKSAVMATTSNSRRVQFEREYTKSSMSFRTENMYTPGGGMERGLPKDKEEMQKMKQEYKRQLRIIYQWMQNLTEVEMGETLGSLVMSAPEGDLRLLTSCLVQRHNERYDVNQLTDSLLLQVFQYLHPRDLSNTAQVCTRWNYLANLDPLWQYHCLNLGKTCGVESLEDLVDAFRLDEPGTNQSALLDEEEPVKISLSSIDWKQAYSELSEAIKEAAAQLGTDDDKPAHILDLDLTDDDVMADTDKEEPTLLDSLRRMRPVIHKMSTGGEDKWYERDNRFRYAHLLSDPILDTLGHIGEEEGEGDLEGLRKEPTSLSDFYEIRSLMDRRKRWKINLPSKEEEDRVNSPAGTQSIFDSLALEMGKMPLDADEKDASERSKGFQLYEESHVDRMSSSQYSEPEMGFLTAAQIKEESLFSFEQREYNQYLDEVARERLEQLKKKRNKLVYVADKLTEKKQKEKEERAKRKRFILTKKKQEEEKEDKSEGTVLKEEVAAELAQDVEEAKSMSRHAGNMSELLHRAQSYLGSLSPSVIDEEDEEGEGKEEEERGEKVEKAVVGQKEIDAEKKRNILEDYVEDAVVRTLNLDRISDSQFSERVKSRVALARMARHEGEERGADDGMRDGQIGLDVRPPVHQPPEIMSERIVRHYDVQWKYPKKVNPFKGARYTNRILHLHALKILHGHMEAVLCMKISAGRIMTGSMDHSVRVWCNGSGRSLHKLYGHRGSVCSIDFNRDWVVSGSWDMTVMVWDSRSYSYIATLFGHLGKVTAIQLTPFLLFTGSHDGTIRVWDISKNFACVRVYEAGAAVTSVTIPFVPVSTEGHKDSHGLAVDVPEDENEKLPLECVFTTCQGSIKIMDLKRNRTAALEGHSAEVTCLRISGNLLISGSQDGQVRFWNKHTLQCESGIQAHNEPVLALEFHRRKFYTASADSTIREWDLYTMTCMRVLHGHKAAVRALKVSDRRIISCSDDGEIRFWQLQDPLEPEMML